MKKLFTILALSTAAIVNFSAVRSGSQVVTLGYIEQWREIAITNQREYGIPASITLAQGIHESASGTSRMAREAKNHFGIKHMGWSGEAYKTKKGRSLYRKYNYAEDSFCDHARILKSQKRYAFMFKLDVEDYQNWAKGLKKAGYAGDKNYPKYLVRVIEEYGLMKYDLEAKRSSEPQEVSI